MPTHGHKLSEMVWSRLLVAKSWVGMLPQGGRLHRKGMRRWGGGGGGGNGSRPSQGPNNKQRTNHAPHRHLRDCGYVWVCLAVRVSAWFGTTGGVSRQGPTRRGLGCPPRPGLFSTLVSTFPIAPWHQPACEPTNAVVHDGSHHVVGVVAVQASNQAVWAWASARPQSFGSNGRSFKRLVNHPATVHENHWPQTGY